ncbi:VTT domain-containing protein [Undibacterium sp. SXout7W]|uniref:VTT domain-containing protein n=1 Tax=Undibacterium sp. SXout7W TaxID=3413049 RepID=UPI003BF0F1A8
MDTSSIADFFAHNSSLLVFGNVLLQQLGLPVPAVPTMMWNASQMTSAGQLLSLLIAAVTASLVADMIWYQAGKIYGYKILKFLCKMSINPGSCVNQTEARFLQWGVWSLIFGKFIPGFSTVAPPVAGAMGMPRAAFLFASAAGAGLWAGLALLAGYALQAQFDAALALLSAYGIRMIFIVAIILMSWLGWKFWQKRRFEMLSGIPHISVAELAGRFTQHQTPHIIDLRNGTLAAETGCIPGAVISNQKTLAQVAAHWPKEELIVTICACPGDAGAIHAAHTLKEMGYQDVRPLTGGFEAWHSQATMQPGLLVCA